MVQNIICHLQFNFFEILMSAVSIFITKCDQDPIASFTSNLFIFKQAFCSGHKVIFMSSDALLFAVAWTMI